MHTQKIILPVLLLMSLVFLSACTLWLPDNAESSLRPERPQRGEQHRRENYAPISQEIPTDRVNIPSVDVQTVPVAPVTPIVPKSTPVTPTKTTAPTTPTSNSKPVTSNKTISKSITYSTDHGQERVTATFSITTDSSGEITAVSSSTTSADRESRQYISRFNSAARSQIIGRKISELSLSAVGWASDTTDAFMQVVSAL